MSTSGGVANAIVSRTRAALGLALLTGIGFTVSLLIGELAFGTGTAAGEGVKIGVLLARCARPHSPPSSSGCATPTTAGCAPTRSATTCTSP